MTRFLLGSSGIEVNATNQQGETPLDVILSRLPQEGVAADEVSEIIREAGGLSKDKTGHAELNMPPPAATEETDAKWLKDMRKSLMVVAALIATITFETGISGQKKDDSQDSKAAPPISAGNNITYYRTIDHGINFLEERQYVAFLLFDTTSLFASLTVILLLLTRFPVKRQWLVVFLSRITHLAIFCMGSAFLLLVLANKDNKGVVPFLATIWTGWSYLTNYVLVTDFLMAARHILARLGMKRLLVAPKTKCLSFLIKGLRVIMTIACALVLFSVIRVLSG